MNVYIAPYNMGSESARALARSLGSLRISGDKRLRTCVVINWGRSDLQLRGYVQRIINRPEAVALAVNKVKTFQTLVAQGVSTVDYTTDRNTAIGWAGDGNLVFARTNAAGSQGRGIVLVNLDDTMPHAPLYTKAFIKTHEYRVHVAFGKVIDFSKKRKRVDTEVNPYIKNSANGWVFCREGIELPEAVCNESIKAVAALGLDFGAIDILYKERDNVAKVLEVNCSPGIEGTTLIKYTETFKNMLNIGGVAWQSYRRVRQVTTLGLR